MTIRALYGTLCVPGAIVPYSVFVPWLASNGLDLPLLIRELFATRIGAFFGLDVIVSSVVLWVFVFSEGRRLGIRRLWMPILASLVVGVSLALPLFLYQRQARLDRAA